MLPTETRIRPVPCQLLESFWGKQLPTGAACPTKRRGRRVLSTLLEGSRKTDSHKGRGTHEKGPMGREGAVCWPGAGGPLGARLGKRDTCSRGTVRQHSGDTPGKTTRRQEKHP